MPHLTRRHLLIAVPLVFLVLGAVVLLLLGRGQDLSSRSALISGGMPREQVVDILGRPELVMRRTGDKGFALIWTDQFWQVDVITDPNGRAESIGRVPSDSLYRRTVGRLTSFPGNPSRAHVSEVLFAGSDRDAFDFDPFSCDNEAMASRFNLHVHSSELSWSHEHAGSQSGLF
jgi:hypothetical protein